MDDTVYDFEMVTILIHQKDFVYFDNTKLDYVQDVFGKGRFHLITI